MPSKPHKPTSTEFSIEGLTEFAAALSKASDEIKHEIDLWLEGLGFDFLREVQQQIIDTQTVDYRRLLNSFTKGGSDNVWKISDGGLTLEVGTNVTYADYANRGHWTIDPASGKDRRWVPGYWEGERFVYDPTAKTGMLLTIKYIPGTHYWDNAFTIFEKIFQTSLEKKIEHMLSRL